MDDRDYVLLVIRLPRVESFTHLAIHEPLWEEVLKPMIEQEQRSPNNNRETFYQSFYNIIDCAQDDVVTIYEGNPGKLIPLREKSDIRPYTQVYFFD